MSKISTVRWSRSLAPLPCRWRSSRDCCGVPLDDAFVFSSVLSSAAMIVHVVLLPGLLLSQVAHR